jgi:hypothetical protein
MTRYSKTIVATLIAGLTVLASAISDNVITAQEWTNIALACLGALGVYVVPNRPSEHQIPDPGMSEQDPQRVPPLPED